MRGCKEARNPSEPSEDRGGSFCCCAAAVKDAVVDAVDELYLGNFDAEAAADNLVGLAQGSSLGASCRLRCVCQEWCDHTRGD